MCLSTWQENSPKQPMDKPNNLLNNGQACTYDVTTCHLINLLSILN